MKRRGLYIKLVQLEPWLTVASDPFLGLFALVTRCTNFRLGELGDTSGSGAVLENDQPVPSLIRLACLNKGMKCKQRIEMELLPSADFLRLTSA